MIVKLHPLANKHTSFRLPITNDETKLGFMHYYKGDEKYLCKTAELRHLNHCHIEK